MANNYTEGTGAFVFDGEPKLSPVSTILMSHIHQYDKEYQPGFYLDEDAYVSCEDVVKSLIGYALKQLKNDAENKTLKLKLEKVKAECSQFEYEAFQKLPDLLREAGVSVNDTLAEAIRNEATHPIDYVLAVIEDRESNLLAAAYEEAYRCDKLRLGEFGGVGFYYSRNVNFISGSSQGVNYGADLDKAILNQDMPAITALVSKQLAKVLDAILNSDLRQQVAKKLLAGEALHIIEDGVTSQVDGDEKQPEYIPSNLSIEFFKEILANVETVAGIGEQYGQQTLIDLIYLQNFLARYKPGSAAFIEQTHGSRIIEFLHTLPNGKRYLKFVSADLSDETISTTVKVASELEQDRFLNHYRCSECGQEWNDIWSATCDDDCPKCGARHISPYASDDYPSMNNEKAVNKL